MKDFFENKNVMKCKQNNSYYSDDFLDEMSNTQLVNQANTVFIINCSTFLDLKNGKSAAPLRLILFSGSIVNILS